MRIRWSALGAVVSVVVLFGKPAAAGTIYSDDFNRTGNLSGSTPSPTDTDSATWTAASSYTVSSGSAVSTAPGVGGLGTEAYLPVDLSAAGTYTLSATLTPTAGTTGDWISLGFIATGATNNQFQANPPNPQLWVLFRDNGGTQSFYGGGTANAAAGSATTGGSSDTFTISLNSSTGAFTISDSKGLLSRSASLTTAQVSAIHDVAIGSYQNGHGSFSSFSLTTTAPEPGSAGLLAIAAGGLLVRRRRA